jgi:thioredoxin 1
MKELLISFLIALILGAIINGYLKGAESPSPAADKPNPVQNQNAQPRTNSKPAPAGSEAAGGSLVSDTSDSSFPSDVIQSDKPVLVDFFATWCSPCKQMAPTIEQIAQDHKDSLKVMRIDVDYNPEVSAKYQVMQIPTLILFKDGEPKFRHTGLMPYRQLSSNVDTHLSL